MQFAYAASGLNEAVARAFAVAHADFLRRLDSDARALSDCVHWLSKQASETALRRVHQIAHALAGAGGIYGFSAISRDAAVLALAAEDCLAGRIGRQEVEGAVMRLLRRISVDNTGAPSLVGFPAATRRRRRVGPPAQR